MKRKWGCTPTRRKSAARPAPPRGEGARGAARGPAGEQYLALGRRHRAAGERAALAVRERRGADCARAGARRRHTRARRGGERRGLARSPAGRRPASRRARWLARAVVALGGGRISGSAGAARARLVHAAARAAARRSRRHAHHPCAGRGRVRGLRDDSRRPATLLAPTEIAGALRVKIVERSFQEIDRHALVQAGVHPLLAKIYAGRRIRSITELAYSPAALLPPLLLKGIENAATLLADAILGGKRLLIIADYDADGATACAVGMRALRLFGANVDYLVPDRFKLGYGLSPELVELAAQRKPDLLITVDNGIASVEGVARAKALGIATLITDHHLPGPELPQADCIVNPNQGGCEFPSKALAGCGVMFYVMIALRAELRKRGALKGDVNLGALTDLVALGTIADVVPLDANNRNLVSQGLKRIRSGRAQPGITALLRAAGRNVAETSSFDLGFVAGPRLNAAGRLADMSLGIECLTTDDEARAFNCAQELDRLNRQRREIEAGMLEQASEKLQSVAAANQS